MKVIKYNNSTIYQKLRYLNEHDLNQKIGIIFNEELAEKDFSKRFIVNGWNNNNLYYYILNSLTEIALTNLKETVELWNGGIVIDLNTAIPESHIHAIIDYALINNLDVYLSNDWVIDTKNTKIHSMENLYEL